MKIRKVVRDVFCNFGFGGAWVPLLYLNEGHAVSCDSYSTKTAKTIFTTSNPCADQNWQNDFCLCSCHCPLSISCYCLCSCLCLSLCNCPCRYFYLCHFFVVVLVFVIVFMFVIVLGNMCGGLVCAWLVGVRVRAISLDWDKSNSPNHSLFPPTQV